MKKIVILLLLLLLPIVIYAQPQLEHNLDQVSHHVKLIIVYFFIIVIVIYGVGATIMSLMNNKKNCKKN